jgi:Na+/H+ antiporter NhaC
MNTDIPIRGGKLMSSYDWLLPPAITMVATLLSRKIIPSIFLGIILGCFFKADGNLLKTLDLINYYLVTVVTDENNGTVLLFLFCFAALNEIFKVGGGISGFANVLQRVIHSEKGVYVSVWLATPLTFMDCCFHAISTGIIAKAMSVNRRISVDRLALIINATSSQLIPLIPVATTYVGYIIGILTPLLLQENSGANPYLVYLQALPYNFYSITMVAFSLVLTFSGFEPRFLFEPAYKQMHSATAEEKNRDAIKEANHQHKFDEKTMPHIWNLIIPLLFMILLVLYLIWRSGMNHGANGLFGALLVADYNQSILSATLATLVFTAFLYVLQKISLNTLQHAFFEGGLEILPPIVIIILAWTLVALSRDLGFYEGIKSISGHYVPHSLLPAVLFIISGIISYAIGSTWATWALVLPVALSMGSMPESHLPMVLGAVFAGGSIGDSISPLGEEPVLVASLTGISVNRHTAYMRPYGLGAAVISFVGYLIVGYGIK